jgi:hypothetical protein
MDRARRIFRDSVRFFVIIHMVRVGELINSTREDVIRATGEG